MNQKAVSPANMPNEQENEEAKRSTNCNPQPPPRESSRPRERAFDELQVNMTTGEYARDVVRVEPVEAVEEQKEGRELRQRMKRRSHGKQKTGHWNKEEHLQFIRGNFTPY